MKAKRFILVAILTFCQPLWAQQSYTNSGRSFKRNVATVLFASIGGAVLGLSTLSFYGEPQEHTNNITLGALLGFVGGVGYVAFEGSKPAQPAYDVSFTEFEQKMKRETLLAAKNPPLIRFQFDF